MNEETPQKEPRLTEKGYRDLSLEVLGYTLPVPPGAYLQTDAPKVHRITAELWGRDKQIQAWRDEAIEKRNEVNLLTAQLAEEKRSNEQLRGIVEEQKKRNAQHNDYEVELEAKSSRLKSELLALKVQRAAYASEFPWVDGGPDVGSIHQNIRGLKAQVERLESEVKEWKDRFDRHEKEWKRSVDYKNSQVEQLQAQIKELEKDNAKWLEEIAGLTNLLATERDDFGKKETEILAENQKLREDIKHFRSHIFGGCSECADRIERDFLIRQRRKGCEC